MTTLEKEKFVQDGNAVFKIRCSGPETEGTSVVVNATEVQHLIETKEVVKLIPQKPIPQRTVQEMEAVPIQMHGKIAEPNSQEVSGSMVGELADRGKTQERNVEEIINVQVSQVMEETTKAVKIIPQERDNVGSENTTIYGDLQGDRCICFDKYVGSSKDQGAYNSVCPGNFSQRWMCPFETDRRGDSSRADLGMHRVSHDRSRREERAKVKWSEEWSEVIVEEDDNRRMIGLIRTRCVGLLCSVQQNTAEEANEGRGGRQEESQEGPDGQGE